LFKTTVQNECRCDNNATLYKHIHQINETNFKVKNQQYILKSCDTHAYKHRRNRAEEWGQLVEGVTGDRKYGMSQNMFADSARIEGRESHMQQCGFHWSNCSEVGYGGHLVKCDDKLQIWLQSGKII
jgi:hypothetical protein